MKIIFNSFFLGGECMTWRTAVPVLCTAASRTGPTERDSASPVALLAALQSVHVWPFNQTVLLQVVFSLQVFQFNNAPKWVDISNL